jgi:hypothetical protein
MEHPMEFTSSTYPNETQFSKVSEVRAWIKKDKYHRAPSPATSIVLPVPQLLTQGPIPEPSQRATLRAPDTVIPPTAYPQIRPPQPARRCLRRNYRADRWAYAAVHRTLDIMFSLVVDDFGVWYGSQSDIDHLEKTLQLNDYKITIRPDGNQFLGMNITFNTARIAVTISMPGYVHKMLTRFRPQFLEKAHRPP